MSGARRRRLARLEAKRGGSAYARAQAIADRYLNPLGLDEAQKQLLVALERRVSPYWTHGDEAARERWHQIGPGGRFAALGATCADTVERALFDEIMRRVAPDQLATLDDNLADWLL